jgi:Zn-dependent protease
MDDLVGALVWYVAFVLSTTLHEASHALAAKLGGDPTAYEGGQVSIDPVPHIRREPVGMVVLPIAALVLFGWPFGFASAPYDPVWAERHPRRAAWMSLAGPGANLALVAACAVCIWLGVAAGEFQAPSTANFTRVVSAVNGGLWESAAFIVSVFFTLNLILFLFNLLPLPPLDGSGALPLLLSEDLSHRMRALASQPMLGLIGFVIAWRVFGPIFDPIFTFALNVLYPGAGYH